MELSAKDLDLIATVSGARRHRKRAAWIVMGVLLLAWACVFYFIDALDSVLPVLAAFSAMAALALVDQFTNQQSENIENLLLRYVNSDPKSIEQVAEHARSRLQGR